MKFYNFNITLLFYLLFLVTRILITLPSQDHFYSHDKTRRGRRGGKRKQRRTQVIPVCIGHRPRARPKLQRPPTTVTHINCIVTDDVNSLENQKRPVITILNAQSVRNKALPIQELIIEKDSDIAFITESWLSERGDEVIHHDITPPLYKLCSHPRTTGRGGGICVVYRDHLKIKIDNIKKYTSFECTSVHAFQTVFICIYHPPPSRSLFLSEIEDLLESYSTTDRLVILGDINIHFDSSTDSHNQAMKRILANHHLRQIVNLPTHKKGHILDWVITNMHIIDDLEIKDECISDHFVVTFTTDIIRPTIRDKKLVTSRNLRAVDITSFCQDVGDTIFDLCPDDSSMADALDKALRDTLEIHAPLRTREISDRTSAPWLTDEVVEARRHRRVAERRWRKSRSDGDRHNFKQNIQHVKDIIVKAKRNYFSEKIENCNNSKQLFNIVKQMFGNSVPSTLPCNIPKEELPDAFVNFFNSKVSKLRQDLDSCQKDNVITNSSCMAFSGSTLEQFKEVTASEVREIITSSPPKTCSLDPIPTKLLIQCLDSIINYITTLINYSLRSGTVPFHFKAAIVSPLLKKANLDPENFKNYRPVSNLNFISKILEKVVLKRLKEHLISNDLIAKFQSAYKAKHSTETALLKIVNDLLLSCDEGKVSVLALLDLSAAFDTIDHAILCNSLYTNFGLRGTVLEWFVSYLTDRSQSVVINGEASTCLPLKFGVPQGSVLGPVLYTLYTMPLGHIIESHSVCYHMYADDTQLYNAVLPSDIMSLSHNIQSCCNSIKSWMQCHKLKLNDDKTEILLCATEPKLKYIEMPSIKIAEAEIFVSKKAKNLGFVLNGSLDMDCQIKNMVAFINFELKKIAQVKKYLPPRSLKTIVSALVLSRLDYCNSLLAGLPDTKLNKLQRVQNRAARLVLGIPFSEKTNVSEMLRTLHWLPIKARIEFKIALLCFNAQNSLSPPYIEDLINPYTPPRQLRSCESKLLQVPKTHLKRFGDRSFSKFGPTVWNSLPVSLRLVTSQAVFKKRLKTYFFTKYL